VIDKILKELEKEGFCHISGLLDAEYLKKLNNFIDENKESFQAARIGNSENRKRETSVRGDYTFWLDPLEMNDPFSSIFDFLNTVKEKINSKFYLGLQEFECHLAYYPPGTFYKKHLDRFEKNGSRKLSFIFYLNQEWQDSDGGELVMYDQSGGIVKSISPMPGDFVCFLSEEYPHEVKAATKERRSLTGWVHSKIIY
jgi:SM-20-related protein